MSATMKAAPRSSVKQGCALRRRVSESTSMQWSVGTHLAIGDVNCALISKRANHGFQYSRSKNECIGIIIVIIFNCRGVEPRRNWIAVDIENE